MPVREFTLGDDLITGVDIVADPDPDPDPDRLAGTDPAVLGVRPWGPRKRP
ncbi:hypothetical protein [Streptomyces yangpuensis]|uniref:hypothetical protein n=1 Tax=Streptomyces yangpuensis TaxID=1648182 RepID=UPI003723DAFB